MRGMGLDNCLLKPSFAVSRRPVSQSRQCRTCIAMHARNKRARRRAKNV